MPKTENDLETKELESSYEDSLGQEEVERGVEELEDLANSNQAEKDRGSRGLASRGASAFMNATPLGRVLGFMSKNRKGFLTGGGILGGLIGIVMFIASITTPATILLSVGNMMDEFNFGPGNRNIAGQVRRIKANIGEIRAADTNQAQRAQSIENVDRALATSEQQITRQQKRFNFRSTVTFRSGASWGGLLGTPRSPTDSPSRRMYGVDEGSRRSATNQNLGGELDADRMNDIADSDNPRLEARVSARQFVGNSILAGVLAAGCISSIASDAIPDEGEIYEYLLAGMADFKSSVSQLADGETVDGDQVADMLEGMHYSEEIIEFADSARDLTPQERAEIEAEIAEIQAEIDAIEEEEGTEAALRQRAAFIGENPNLEVGEQVRSFSHSAAYKRMANLEVTGDELDYGMTFPGLEDRLKEGPAGGFIRTGDTINFLTAGLAPGACRFVTNPLVGWALTGADVVLTAKACIATLGAGCGGRVALFAVTEALARGVSWLILSLTFNSLIPEGPEELMAYWDMGNNLGETEHMRAMGAPPISNEVANANRNEHFALLGQEDREKGFMWRYLSTENSRSFLNGVALAAHTQFSVSNTLSYLTRPFTILSSSIKSMVLPVGASTDFDNYEIQKYGFSEQELSVDPVALAIDVEHSLRCAAGNQTPEDNCTESRIREGQIMRDLLQKCIDEDTSDPYHEMDRLCTNPNSTERTAWGKVGVYTLNNVIIDSLACFSHDRDCDTSAPTRQEPLNIGDAADIAQSLLSRAAAGDIGIDATPRSQLEDVAEGSSDLLDARILAVVDALATRHEFTITSLRRESACNPAGSRHTCGLAADFSGSRGIDGVTYGYEGHNQTIQNFINSAAEALLEIGPQNCGIGVPNNRYVAITSEAFPSCTVFEDRGSSPHIHIDVRQ